jgi:F0F1-type ATP synthase delta subunit
MLSESTQDWLNRMVVKSEVLGWLQELDILERAVYGNTPEVFEQALENEVSSEMSALIKNEMEIRGGVIGVRSDILRELKDGVNSLKIVKLEVAVDVSKEMLKRIHNWLKENVGAGIILEMVTNDDVVMGAKISFQGRYIDVSAQKRWSEVWEQTVKEFALRGGG